MENAQLTIADLASIHSMLDAACSRGAFKAAEMTQVGQVYDKLTAFLQSIQDKSEAEPQAEPVAETQGE
jgi:hypothetical protein